MLNGRTAGRSHSRSGYAASCCVATARSAPAMHVWQRFACCATAGSGLSSHSPREAGARRWSPRSTNSMPCSEKLPENDITNYGIVIEENLRHVTTRSVGHITVDDLTVSYFGTQRFTTNNTGQSVYGGSNLLCVRGGWEALDSVAIPEGLRLAVTQARQYDGATSAFPGFLASRRNYDIGEGIDAEGRPRSGVFEASWRVGGATGAEVIALTAFKQDPSLYVIDVSHIEEFGQNRRAPDGAIVLFEGDDPRDGPMIRYTIVNRMERRAE